jgi:hypothetical protein
VSTPAELLIEFRQALGEQLHDTYGMRASAVDTHPPTSDGAKLVAFARAASVHYPVKVGAQEPVDDQICFELHRASDTDSYWLCVPHPCASTYLWYQFAREPDGSFVSVPHPKLVSTPYPFWLSRPVIANTGDWTGHEDYGLPQGSGIQDNPPHWSPVLVSGTHQEKVHHGGKGPVAGASLTVDVPNFPDPAVTKKLHDFMASSATIYHGVEMIDKARPVEDNLSKRVASNLWPPITLRGLVADSALSGGDYSGDHSTAFIEDGGPDPGLQGSTLVDWGIFSPVGPLSAIVDVTEYVTSDSDLLQISDPDWPGMDWDVTVTTDADVRYLSSVEREGNLQVEIEQFAYRPSSYRPHNRDWLQTTGRWIFDCGHSGHTGEHYAEIHPPELIVNSHLVGQTAHTSAFTTGAWLGTPLSFVVFPPPRPDSFSKLLIWSNVDAQQLASFECQRWPLENPNHVVCTITADEVSEDQAPPVGLSSSGMVAMSRRRFLRARVQCFWSADEQIAIAHVEPGVVGVRVYIRDPAVANAPWGEMPLKLPETLPPAYELALPPNKSYELRGAGSGRDYAPETFTFDVGISDITLHPTKETYPPPPLQLPIKPGIIVQDISPAPPEPDDWYYLRQAAIETLAEQLVASAGFVPPLSAAPSLVSSDKTSAAVVIILLSLVDDDGAPVTDLESVVKKPGKASTGAEYYENIPSIDGQKKPFGGFIAARPGPPVAGAKFQAQLLLGNEMVGEHIVGQCFAVTDADGTAVFSVGAGSHPEDVTLRLSVLDNPANRWFTPVVDSASGFFGPGARSDLEPKRDPYTLIVPVSAQLAADIDLNAIRTNLARKVENRSPSIPFWRPTGPLQVAPKQP